MVVDPGETDVEPLACPEEKPPGAMLMLAAPLVFHCRLLLDPALMVVGFAANERIVGTGVGGGGAVTAFVDPAQFASAIMLTIAAPNKIPRLPLLPTENRMRMLG